VAFQVQHHAVAYTAQEVAAAEHTSGRTVAKVVMAFADERLVMLVLRRTAGWAP
jgi:Ala-tRNA(Pro) deacylase